jgi:Tol biopolymer transport system component
MSLRMKGLVVSVLVACCVTTASAAQEASPFPHGWIVFTGDAQRGVYCCFLFEMRTDGSGLRKLAGMGVVHDDTPAFAPNGRRVAFTSNPEGAAGPGLFAVNLDGSRRSRLTSGETDRSAAYSPDGKRIVFLRGYPRQDLYVMSAGGHGQRRLRRGFPSQGRPSWTPDGRSIVFAASGPEHVILSLYTVDSRTGRIQRHRFLQSLSGKDCCYGDALLSPDGHTLVFIGEKTTCTDCEPATALYRTPYPRGPVRRVRYACGMDSWSSDSRVLATGASSKINLCVLRDGRTKSIPVPRNVYAEYAALQPR